MHIMTLYLFILASSFVRSNTGRKSDLIFVHVGKCGGTSISAGLRRAHIKFSTFHINPLYEQNISDNKGNSVVITVRDPLERVMSAFDWRNPSNGIDGLEVPVFRMRDREIQFYDCFPNMSQFVRALTSPYIFGNHSKCPHLARSTVASFDAKRIPCFQGGVRIPSGKYDHGTVTIGHITRGFGHYLSGVANTLKKKLSGVESSFSCILIHNGYMQADFNIVLKMVSENNAKDKGGSIPRKVSIEHLYNNVNSTRTILDAEEESLLRIALRFEYEWVDLLERVCENGKYASNSPGKKKKSKREPTANMHPINRDAESNCTAKFANEMPWR